MDRGRDLAFPFIQTIDLLFYFSIAIWYFNDLYNMR